MEQLPLWHKPGPQASSHLSPLSLAIFAAGSERLQHGLAGEEETAVQAPQECFRREGSSHTGAPGCEWTEINM
jgi:hypothetical protein